MTCHVFLTDQANAEESGEEVVISKDLKEKLQVQREKEYEIIL